eukprot:TRINITY_DN11175_c0_g1_i3.p2 TRINITY_DN11175_c0_g1~~TRINITY_DN11175_c0_g1_i3.p2  ORF type:complete len:352 (+),score=42.45 TRINITY_DN11175_c0_g1_i3:2-1057(+)
MMDKLFIELQPSISTLRVFSPSITQVLSLSPSLDALTVGNSAAAVPLPLGVHFDTSNAKQLQINSSGARITLVNGIAAAHPEPSPIQTPLQLQCRACGMRLSHKDIVAFPAPSDRWAEVADFVNCCDDHPIETHVHITRGRALLNNLIVRLAISDIAPQAVSSHDNDKDDTNEKLDEHGNETPVVICARCLMPLGRLKCHEYEFDRHCVTTTFNDTLSELSRVGLKLRQVMIARGHQRFLLSSKNHRGQANVPFIAAWFPSTGPVKIWRERDRRWIPVLKCLYSDHVGDRVSPEGVELGAEWHGDDGVDQLELPYETLLEATLMLKRSTVLLPPGQRSMRGLTVGYWMLDD